MGQSFNKLENYEEKKEKVIERCYDLYFVDSNDWTPGDFYHAICKTVEEINKTIGSTQLRVPKAETLRNAYEKHHKGKGKTLTKEEFQKIMQEVIFDTGVTNIGAKDMLFYLFGVPATALFLKQRTVPKVIPNEVFIPVITSATVFFLAFRNKI